MHVEQPSEVLLGVFAVFANAMVARSKTVAAIPGTKRSWSDSEATGDCGDGEAD
jgi:hypothetical protein